MVTLAPTEGREHRGHRPVLVVSPAEFNEVTKLQIAVLMSRNSWWLKRLTGPKNANYARAKYINNCNQADH
ncbi:MAG: type II toxin-antitoxin system PemK/MazF family toxin [Candidatus Melainabacteria bacterium]|nr:type II toxin-antitoxin system PemK/MazF family toxin [Candidatus Melainabacteria bacterium]